MDNSEKKCKICAECPAWPRSLFKGLNTAQLQILSTQKTGNHFKKNDFLFKQSELVSGIYCNADGLLKITQTDNSEKIKFSRLVYPGDSAGHRSLFIEEKYKGSASVISDEANICFIKKEDILSLFATNNEFAKELITKLSTELARSVETQIEIKERSVVSRLSSLLLDLFDNFSDKNEDGISVLRLTISKVEIARLLSVADETVIRIMSDMKNESILESNGKYLVLLDYDKLKRFSLP